MGRPLWTFPFGKCKYIILEDETKLEIASEIKPPLIEDEAAKGEDRVIIRKSHFKTSRLSSRKLMQNFGCT